MIDDLADGPPVVADLEVFNRTEEDIFLVSSHGQRLDVPACDRAVAEAFPLDEVVVRAEAGYIRSFGTGDQALMGQRAFLVEVTSVQDSGIPTRGRPPDPLPPCEGLPQVQEGV